ncbi:MAG: hypothetical protein IPF83_02775 [Rhodanobacteraceae bacterium]|nr:hypothetical protein [Rhodanobacteraceae bacterium]
MFDLIAITADIVFVILVLQLRAMLAMPFLKQTARCVAGDWSPLLAAEDVIAVANREWSTLGFTGPQRLSITPQPIAAANVRAIACWRRERWHTGISGADVSRGNTESLHQLSGDSAGRWPHPRQSTQ